MPAAGVDDLVVVEARVGAQADRPAGASPPRAADRLGHEAGRAAAGVGHPFAQAGAEHVAGAGHGGQQRVVAALAVAVDPGRALLVEPVGLAVGRVDVDGHRPWSGPGAGRPRPPQRLLGDLVELAGRAPGERAQERPQRGRRGDAVAEDLAGGAGAQPIGVTDPLAAGQRRVDQGHGLVADVGRAGRLAEIDMGGEQLTEHQPLGQAGGKDQAGVGDGMVIVEGDGDLIRAVG